MSTQIYRYEVPVDGQRHTVSLFGDPLGVGCRKFGVLEFWAYHDDVGLGLDRTFIAVGTGHDLPRDAQHHWGHAVDGGGSLVWHLIEVAS